MVGNKGGKVKGWEKRKGQKVTKAGEGRKMDEKEKDKKKEGRQYSTQYLQSKQNAISPFKCVH